MYNFLGARAYSFTPEGETQVRTGVTVYLMEAADPAQGVGYIPVKCGVSTDFWQKQNAAGEYSNATGKPVNVSFNRYGKLESMSLVATNSK